MDCMLFKFPIFRIGSAWNTCSRTPSDWTEMHTAISADDCEEVKRLVNEEGNEVNVIDFRQRSPCSRDELHESSKDHCGVRGRYLHQRGLAHERIGHGRVIQDQLSNEASRNRKDPSAPPKSAREDPGKALLRMAKREERIKIEPEIGGGFKVLQKSTPYLSNPVGVKRCEVEDDVGASSCSEYSYKSGDRGGGEEDDNNDEDDEEVNLMGGFKGYTYPKDLATASVVPDPTMSMDADSALYSMNDASSNVSSVVECCRNVLVRRRRLRVRRGRLRRWI